jgi:hypothetical protein
VESNTIAAFRVAKGSASTDIGFNTGFTGGSGFGSYWNGAVMRGYSNDGSLQTYILNAADGSADFTGTLDVDGAATFNGSVTLGNATGDIATIKGHLVLDSDSLPSVAIPASSPAAGTGGSVGASINRGNDLAGEIQVITGSSGTTTGTLVDVSFAAAKPDSDYLVFLTPNSINASDLNLSITSRSSTGFSIRANTAPGTGETLNIQYLVIEV